MQFFHIFRFHVDNCSSLLPLITRNLQIIVFTLDCPVPVFTVTQNVRVLTSFFFPFGVQSWTFYIINIYIISSMFNNVIDYIRFSKNAISIRWWKNRPWNFYINFINYIGRVEKNFLKFQNISDIFIFCIFLSLFYKSLCKFSAKKMKLRRWVNSIYLKKIIIFNIKNFVKLAFFVKR